MIVKRRGLLAFVLGLAALLVVGRAWGALIGDHAWFNALGFGDVWWWRTGVALSLKFGAGTIATLVMRAHLEGIRRSFVSVVVPGNIGNIEFNGAVPERTISAVLWVAAFGIGILLTIPIGDWMPLASVLDARPFGETDPYFQFDLAFWTTWLPFEMQLYTWALLSHAVMSLTVVVAYVLTRGIGTDGRALRVTRHARRHITVLGALLLVLIAWSYRIDGFDKLLQGTRAEGAFGFADHRVGLPGSIVMQVITLAAAAVVIWSAWSRQPRAGVGAVTTVLLMALLLRQGTPLLADSVTGGDDALARERRYLDAGASFTRRAYESDRVLVANESDTASLASTPLWDRTTLPRSSPDRLASLLAWNATDAGPQAYAFETVRARGLLPTWRLIPLDVVLDNPFPNTPTRNSATLPPIVVSDSGRGYAIVSDPLRRIAAPSIASFSSRLAQAWNLQNPRLLFSTIPSPGPVLVTVRDVRDRVIQLVPSFLPGEHVVPIVAADSLWWALDLYAVSSTYPLSERAILSDTRISAAQFAATAIVNAHTGAVILVSDTQTPILARDALQRFRRHLTPIENLPGVLRRQLPPRVDAMALEAGVAARHGSRTVQEDTSTLARTKPPMTDFSLVPALTTDTNFTADEFAPVWLPDRGAFAVAAAAIDRKGLVHGVMIAPGGADRRTRWRPSADRPPYESIIRAAQDAADSLRTPGTLVGARRGVSRILPSGGSPRFVTPFFSMRDGRPTQLSAVLITDGVRRGTAASVAVAALAWRNGGRAVVGESAAATLYRQMRESLQRGAWADFGSSFEALGRTLGVPRDSAPR
jgi:uncharacterized protein